MRHETRACIGKKAMLGSSLHEAYQNFDAGLGAMQFWGRSTWIVAAKRCHRRLLAGRCSPHSPGTGPARALVPNHVFEFAGVELMGLVACGKFALVGCRCQKEGRRPRGTRALFDVLCFLFCLGSVPEGDIRQAFYDAVRSRPRQLWAARLGDTY